jgi:hypothetical protein
VQVIVDSVAFGDENAGSGPHVVNYGGQVVCGIPDPDGVLRNYAHFIAAVTHGCVFRDVDVSGNIFTYKQLFTDLDPQTHLCPDDVTSPVSGSFKGIAGSAVGDITTMLTYCQGGNPDSVPPVPATGPEKCLLIPGITADVNESFFDRRVCPKDPSTGRNVDGQILAYKETKLPSGEFRPGKISTCSCQSDLDGGDVTCGQGNTGEPINSDTAGAIQCEFDFANAGNPLNDTIDLNGKNQINGAIYDSAACPVKEIDTKTLRVCNNVTPRQIKIGTAQGRPALSFQFSEPDCVKSMQVSVPLVAGDIRLIHFIANLKDGTGITGADDVRVQE